MKRGKERQGCGSLLSLSVFDRVVPPSFGFFFRACFVSLQFLALYYYYIGFEAYAHVYGIAFAPVISIHESRVHLDSASLQNKRIRIYHCIRAINLVDCTLGPRLCIPTISATLSSRACSLRFSQSLFSGTQPLSLSSPACRCCAGIRRRSCGP